MSLLTIIIALVVVGIVLWAVNEYLPMQAQVKKLLNIVVILLLVFWLLKESGLIAALAKVQI